MTSGQNAFANRNGAVPDGAAPWQPTPLGEVEQPVELAVREHGDGRTEVAVAGEIDFATHQALLGTLTDEIEHGHRRIVLDMSGVTFCDSTGLGVLVQIHQRAAEGGGWLRIAAPTDAVRRALEITNLDRLIPAYATVAEATAAP
jgi:anti-anti-sigma factor